MAIFFCFDKITSGKTITEDETFEKIKEFKEQSKGKSAQKKRHYVTWRFFFALIKRGGVLLVKSKRTEDT
jgi:hypothetical protein